MRQADLERRLEAVPRHPSPSPDLEQYRTPAGIAANLLRIACDEDAVKGKRVLDLGCGTGTFAIGAALLGARLATGIDIDAASVAAAQKAASDAGVAAATWFVVADLSAWHSDAGAFDTVIMNPPFGAQKANRHADRLFLDRATAAVRPHGTVWFLAQERTEGFLQAWSRDGGARLERVAIWDYPLEAQYAFHGSAVRTVRVGGYKLSWP